MKQLFWILLCGTFLTSCASYKLRHMTDDDWKNMTVPEIQDILHSGIDMDDLEEDYGECVLNQACFNTTDINVLETIINAGHNPTHCDLYAYYENNTGSLQELLDDTSRLIKKGYTPTTQDYDALLEKYPQEQKKIKKFFDSYMKDYYQGYALSEISENPMHANEILKKYEVQIPYKTILLTKLQSPVMQEKRNSKEWYALIDEIKKNNIKDGILGMSKEDFVVKYGVPDKEYKINNNTTVLIYRNASRKNIPAVSSTYSFGTTSNYYNGKSYWNNFDNSVHHYGTTNGFNSGGSVTRTAGGYMDIEEWEDLVYVDKGIVTGKNQKQKVTTN